MSLDYADESWGTSSEDKKVERNRVSDLPSHTPSFLHTASTGAFSGEAGQEDFHLSVYSPGSHRDTAVVAMVAPINISNAFNHGLGIYRLIQNIKRLRDGWDGLDAKSPDKLAIKDIERVAHILDHLAKTPACEIEEDGSLKLSWANKERDRKLVLTFRGTGRVVGSLVTTDGTPGSVWKASTVNERELSLRLQDITLDDIVS